MAINQLRSLCSNLQILGHLFLKLWFPKQVEFDLRAIAGSVISAQFRAIREHLREIPHSSAQFRATEFRLETLVQIYKQCTWWSNIQTQCTEWSDIQTQCTGWLDLQTVYRVVRYTNSVQGG